MQFSGDLPKTLFGYKVISHLGDGAASSIYAVADAEGQLYALKHVVKKDEKSQRFIDQIVNEFEVSKRIGVHPNVRRIVDIKYNRTLLRSIIDAGLVMEMIDAAPLSREIAARGSHEDVPWLLNILTQTARGMSAINKAGFVHSDMKPENIMVLADGSAKVIDLGQAAPNGTEKDRVQGSPMFIAPEQMDREHKKVTFRTDVFNFGATLYWALTGKFIPTDYARKKGLAKGSPEEAPTPADQNPAIPKELSDLTMRCVRSKVMERPDSMTSVATQLDAIRQNSGGTTPTTAVA